MRHKEKKSPRRSTASMAAQHMMVGSLPQEEDEVLQSPMQMALHSFVRDKIAMAGVILFGAWQGFWYNYIGICVGSLAAFAIARACGRPLLESLFPPKMIEKYDRWMGTGNRFARWFAFLIFIPVAPDDYLCFLAGTTRIDWRLYTAIIFLCKPAAIALYSLGLTVVAQNVLGLWR